MVHFTGGPRNWLHVGWGFDVRRAGVPYIVSGAGNLSAATYRYRWGGKPDSVFHFLGKKFYYYLFDRPFLRKAAAIHASSRSEAEIATKAGLPDAFVLPFSVIDESPADPQSAIARSVCRPMTFTYLGRLSPVHKGLDIIIDAFGKVVESGFGEQFRLVLAGPSESGSLERLQRRAKDRGVRNVDFPGPTWDDAKAELWVDTDWFLHICRFTGFALATREALCEGLPVIATRESDYGDWVYEHNLGVVVPLDAGALAQAILGVLRLSDEAYRELSSNVIEYTWATRWRPIGKRFAEQYDRIAGTPAFGALASSPPVSTRVAASVV
jgi:glycosyltransferase involved in cell wall biosynthesis